MKVVSWNVNGIRAVERKEVLQPLVKKEKPDILFMQETKAMKEQLSEYLTAHEEYFQFYNSAEKKGYSGTGLWVSKSFVDEEPTITKGMQNYYDDNEGRLLGVDYKDFTFIGGYFPNGGKSEHAWKEKLVFYNAFLKYVESLKKKGRTVIFTGDLNVAHREIDLARPKANDGAVGFHPDERDWVDRVLKSGFIDGFRLKHGDKEGAYTWWRQASRARERNIGWRIDYFMVDKSLEGKIRACDHRTDYMGSDHCPIVLELDI